MIQKFSCSLKAYKSSLSYTLHLAKPLNNLFFVLFSGRSWGEPLSPSPSSDVWSWYSRGRSPTPSPPLSEGGSSSSFWTQNTTDEGIVIDECFDDLPKKKRVSLVLVYWKSYRVKFCSFMTRKSMAQRYHSARK